MFISVIRIKRKFASNITVVQCKNNKGVSHPFYFNIKKSLSTINIGTTTRLTEKNKNKSYHKNKRGAVAGGERSEKVWRPK